MALDTDFVVIGSGFGGSVAAMRLAQRGYSVVVLEAGRRWAPEDLPKSTWDVRRFCWMPGLGAHGILRMALYRHLMAVCGVGVGGGSLVYGNTLYRPRGSFFESEAIARLGGERELGPYLDLATKMMGVVDNPAMMEPDRLLKATADAMGRGHTFAPSPVAVWFGEAGKRAADPYFDGEGPERSGCTLCGGCFLGCRHGAKNTLDKNYLYFAERFGARVVPETRATALRPHDDGPSGWTVDTVPSGGRRGAGRSYTCRGVVVSAGVLGTLELLMTSRDAGHLARISPMLGRRVRSNSEVIVGVTARDPNVDLSRGVAASSSVWLDDHTQVQADRYPKGSDAMGLLSTLLVDGGGKIPRPLRFLAAAAGAPGDFLRSLLPDGFAQRTVFLIVMQDQPSSLRMIRVGRGLDTRAEDVPIPTYLPEANDFARRLAAAMNGFARSAVTEVFLDRPVTAHILGGCAIGTGPHDGVVDDRQRVFGYDHLWVVDGTVIPANLGVNPVLTILGFAERAMAFVPLRAGHFTRLAAEARWGVSELLVRA